MRSVAGATNFINLGMGRLPVFGMATAIIRGQGSQTSVYEYGTISETGEVTCPNCDLVVITGTRNGDNISGTWNYSTGGLTGKWRGKRTL